MSWTHGSYKTWGEYLGKWREDEVRKQTGLKTAYTSLSASAKVCVSTLDSDYSTKNYQIV